MICAENRKVAKRILDDFGFEYQEHLLADADSAFMQFGPGEKFVPEQDAFADFVKGLQAILGDIQILSAFMFRSRRSEDGMMRLRLQSGESAKVVDFDYRANYYLPTSVYALHLQDLFCSRKRTVNV